MPAKTNKMKNLIENALAIMCGVMMWFHNGMDVSQLLHINAWEVVVAMGKIAQVGMAGVVGAVGGAAGKKYFWPWIDKTMKKLFTKK
jgi:hypothetical protein